MPRRWRSGLVVPGRKVHPVGPEKPKYGIFPPLRTASGGPGTPVALYIQPGYSMDEWRANLPRALEELLATFSPEERAEIEAEMQAVREGRLR